MHFVTVKPIILGGLAARLVRTKGVIYAVSGATYFWQMVVKHQAKISRSVLQDYFRAQNATVIVQNPEDAEQIKTFNKT